ncbi:MAG: hypothetical protein AABZ31_09720 [Bdellovibrionota bacterium]
MENKKFFDQYEWFVQNVGDPKIRLLRRILWQIVFHELHYEIIPENLIRGVAQIMLDDLFPYSVDNKKSLGSMFVDISISREEVQIEANEILEFARSLIEKNLPTNI